MDYMSTLQYLSTIEQKLFFSFNHSKYLQNNEYIKIQPWFNYDKKGIKQVKKVPPPKQVLYHKKLHNLFFMLIDPLVSKDDMITNMNLLLDTNRELLKCITPHYKKLQAVINSYLTSTNGVDLSYENEKYLLFWSNLLCSNLYIITGNSFMVYNPLVETQNDILIRIIKDDFEYINLKFNDYCKSNTMFPKINVNKLNSKTIAELKKLCNDCKLELDPKMKKSQLIQELQQVLI